jgi:hypothetical protein
MRCSRTTVSSKIVIAVDILRSDFVESRFRGLRYVVVDSKTNLGQVYVPFLVYYYIILYIIIQAVCYTMLLVLANI